MSKVDKVYAEATKAWNKYRRQGWLKEKLHKNRDAQTASKEAFIGGYVLMALKEKLC
jgi:hypothetical protein